jgi:hypothetical protein
VARRAVPRLFAMDEARFGLKVTHRRLWCPFGRRPPWTHDHQDHGFWLYAAVEPVSGTCLVLFLPPVDGVCFERFLEELRRHTGTDRIGLGLDTSGSHTSGKVRWPEGLAKIALPTLQPRAQPGGALVRGLAPGLRHCGLRDLGRIECGSFCKRT